MAEGAETEAEKSHSSGPLDTVERLAKISSLVAIPVVIAVVGWVLQRHLGDQTLRQEYVKLAVSILEKPKSSEEPLGLRDWAVDLLNQNSPTKFSADTLNQLKSGAINLSSLTSLLQTANPGAGIAASPDGNHVAAGLEDGSIAIWELSSGRLVRKLSGGTDPITAVIYSPDGRRLIAGSISGLLTVWGAETGLILSKISGDKHAVLGMALSPDQKTLLVRSADRHLRSWNLTSLRPVADITLDFAQ